MRIGLGVTPPFDIPKPLAALTDQVRRAEADGFAAVWSPSLPAVGPPDALALLAALAPATERIALGSYVVPTYPRHPAALAQQAYTVQQVSANRLTLGIGLSHKLVIEGSFGISYDRPIRHMREYLGILVPLLAGEPVHVDGDDYSVHQDPLCDPDVVPPPVLVAALQPQMLRLAGLLADGTALGAAGPRYIENVVVPTLASAAHDAGRPTPRVAAMFPIAVSDNRDAVLAAVRQLFPGYENLPSYRALIDAEGVSEIGDLAISGDEGCVRQQLQRLADIGVTDFVATRVVLDEDPPAYERTYELLADIAQRGLR